MSSSESVLPPELIHMVMSYLSDEEKMRLIMIDPGIFDVLTSDERFKAEFNSREFYIVTKNDYDYNDNDAMVVSNISNDREYIVEYVLKQVFEFVYLFGGGTFYINENRYSREYEKRLSLLDEENATNVVNLHNYISSLGAKFERYMSEGVPSVDVCKYGLFLDDSDYGLNSPFEVCRDEVENIRSMVRKCFENALLKDIPIINILVHIALNSYNDLCMTTVQKVIFGSNKQIDIQSKYHQN